MKPVAVLLWMLTAGVVLASIGLFAGPWYLRRVALEELKRLGEIEISEDGEKVRFSLIGPRSDRETLRDLAVLLRRVRCTDLSLGGCPSLKDITGLEQVGSLRSLTVFKTQVSDLSPLAGLSGLTKLDLRVTLVSDLSPLAGLEKFEAILLLTNQEVRIPKSLETVVTRL